MPRSSTRSTPKTGKRRTVPEDPLSRARDLLEYIDQSPTPYHAVHSTIRRLEAAGFEPLLETDPWQLQEGDRRYVTKKDATLIAFIVGTKAPARAGFRMIGAHTDSPNLRVKPRASFTKHGYRQLGVEVYGGVLLSTWLDRDLGVAGRVAIKDKKGVRLELVDVPRPLLRIPNLAIHLNRDVNREGLKINPQTHLPPIWALEGTPHKARGSDETDALLTLIAGELGVPPTSILDHDLQLYDLQKGTVAGAKNEFVQVARLDNLASCHAAVEGLVATADRATPGTRLIALYDHEEVGSKSAQGAGGPFLESVLQRIVGGFEGDEPQGFARAMAASILISADMAHAVHPSYADRHEPQHMPMIGQGPVIKSNVGQSYATDVETAATFTELCQDAGFAPQSFVVRTDLPCGSTIGPITAARLGVKTVDVGNPMLSMHSIREMAGTHDIELMHRALTLFLERA